MDAGRNMLLSSLEHIATRISHASPKPGTVRPGNNFRITSDLPLPALRRLFEFLINDVLWPTGPSLVT
jgi:hypothetical protein